MIGKIRVMRTTPNKHAVIFSFFTLFVIPMALLTLLYSCFMLRPPIIRIENHYLRWLLEYTELYAKYEHAVMSWRSVVMLGAITSVLTVFIESVTRRIQGHSSMVFHVFMAFFIAFVSFYTIRQFHFERLTPRSAEWYSAAQFDVITTSLKNALAYACICYGASAIILRIGNK